MLNFEKSARKASATRSAGTGVSLGTSVEAAVACPARAPFPRRAARMRRASPPIAAPVASDISDGDQRQNVNVMNTFNRRWIFRQSRSSTLRLGATFAEPTHCLRWGSSRLHETSRLRDAFVWNLMKIKLGISIMQTFSKFKFLIPTLLIS